MTVEMVCAEFRQKSDTAAEVGNIAVCGRDREQSWPWSPCSDSV